MAKKEIEAEGALAQEAEHSDLRVYELGFHIDPELPQEEVKKTYQTLREQVSAVATLVAEGEPQKIPLAYTVSRSEHAGRRDFNHAYFAWIAYEADGIGHDAVTLAAKNENRIFRFLDIRTSKEAAQHAAEMHEIYARMAEAPVADVDAADIQLDAALKEAGV